MSPDFANLYLLTGAFWEIAFHPLSSPVPGDDDNPIFFFFLFSFLILPFKWNIVRKIKFDIVY